MLDAGTYRARAVQWGLGETKAGKEQVAVEFVILDVDGTPGQHITWYGHFSEAALPLTVAALRACGWAGLDLSVLEGLDTNEVELVIEHDTYEGKTNAKVRFVNVPRTGGALLKAPLDDAKKKAFAARMRGAIAAMEQGASKPATAKPKAHPRKGVQTPEPPPYAEDPNMPPF
jgi:hypothetical protein